MVHATLDGLLTPRSGVSSEGESQPSNVGSQSVEQGVRGTWFHRIPMVRSLPSNHATIYILSLQFSEKIVRKGLFGTSLRMLELSVSFHF